MNFMGSRHPPDKRVEADWEPKGGQNGPALSFYPRIKRHHRRWEWRSPVQTTVWDTLARPIAVGRRRIKRDTIPHYFI